MASSTDGSVAPTQEEIHTLAVSKGWWESPRTFGDCIALAHAELSEAIEAYRTNGLDNWITPEGKPEGVGVELADCVIRLLDTAEHYGYDLADLMRLKHEYNKTRAYRHGNKLL